MTVLSALMDLQAQTPDCVKFALTLVRALPSRSRLSSLSSFVAFHPTAQVNIALESGGPSLGSIVPLVEVLRGDVCRHLLRATQSDDLAVFSLALRVVFNLFVSIKVRVRPRSDGSSDSPSSPPLFDPVFPFPFGLISATDGSLGSHESPGTPFCIVRRPPTSRTLTLPPVAPSPAVIIRSSRCSSRRCTCACWPRSSSPPAP